MNKLVKESIERMDAENYGTSFQAAYDRLNRSADRMPDDRFMFEAGKRAMRIELERGVYGVLKKAVQKAVNEALVEYCGGKIEESE